MKLEEQWAASKYVYRGGKLAASRDPNEVGLGSRLVTELIARAYEEHLGVYASGRLLDLGCGRVPLYEAYRKMVTENVCVDWANTLHKNGHLDFEADLSRELPIASAEFDTIILSDVLEHIPAPEVLCREMARVLRPGGTLIMNVPFYYWLHEQPHDYYRFTEFALRKLMQEAGLRVVKLTAIGGAPEIIADVFAKSVLHTSRFGALLAALSQKFALWYIGTQRGKRFSEMTRSNFPLAYFLVATKPTTSSPDAAAGR